MSVLHRFTGSEYRFGVFKLLYHSFRKTLPMGLTTSPLGVFHVEAIPVKLNFVSIYSFMDYLRVPRDAMIIYLSSALDTERTKIF
jgi:hypothetical protein